MTKHVPKGRIYLRDTDLAERYSVSRATIWRWVAEGKFAQPVKLTAGTTRWTLDDIMLFESRAQHREDAARLSSRYIKKQIHQLSGIPVAQIPDSLVDAKREHLKLTRNLKKEK